LTRPRTRGGRPQFQAPFTVGLDSSPYARGSSAPAPTTTIVDERTGANIIGVSSCCGDGRYPTFVGYDADGQLTSLVTDFLVVPDKDEEKPL
jgi:hypothetical protein